MDMDQRAGMYWHAFSSDQEFPNGLTFRKALKQCQLDFSRKSLHRIDQLLDQIRLNKKPDPETFLKSPANQDFVFLLAFYLGMLVAKQSQAPIKWLAYEELAGLYPSAKQEYPECFSTTLTCLIGRDRLFLPVSVIVERLFNPDEQRTVRSLTERFIIEPAYKLSFRSSIDDVAPSAQAFATTMHVAGFLAAQAMWDLSEGANSVPTTCTHFADGKKTVKTLVMDTFDAALNAGREDLQNNPENGLGMTLAFDAMLKLAEGPYSAVVFDIRHYQPPLALTFALPYRPKNSGLGFAVHQIKLIESSAPENEINALIDQFFAGVQHNKVACEVWAKHLDESV